MTEKQFIIELEKALNALPVEESNDIILDLREYFANGREDGKTDKDIADSLGSPDEIAADLLSSYLLVEKKVNIDDNAEIFTIYDNDFTKVAINVQHGALVVRPSNNSITTIELDGMNNKLQLTAEVVDQTLLIRLKNLRHWLFMFNFNMKPITLTVSLPKKLYDSLVMKTDNGRITAKKLLGKTINISTDNGRIELKEIAASDLTVKTDNGKIEIDKVQAENISVKTDNGRIDMQHIDAENISAESDNGRINLEDVNGSITGTTDNGRITLETTTLDQNIDFSTDNGSISIKSKTRPTNVSILAKTNNGRIDVLGERNSRTVIGAGENVIRLKSGNGRITVIHP